MPKISIRLTRTVNSEYFSVEMKKFVVYRIFDIVASNWNYTFDNLT